MLQGMDQGDAHGPRSLPAPPPLSTREQAGGTL